MKTKTLLKAAGTALAVHGAWMLFCGYQWGYGPFKGLFEESREEKIRRIPGNVPEYDPHPLHEDDVLNGKHIAFLGSSVTYGAASLGVSFADDIAVRRGCTILKEAVSGTTLVLFGDQNYQVRMEKMDRDFPADLFLCQLSTNDATMKKKLGTLSDSYDPETFDRKTVAGAIEYIIDYAKKTWNCPVAFYTNAYYDSKEYAKMVDLLHEIERKWEITVIDLYSDKAFNDISPEKRELFMKDRIHPTKAGYLLWWTPYIEEGLRKALTQ